MGLRHFLTLQDLSKTELESLLNRAVELKQQHRNGTASRPCAKPARVSLNFSNPYAFHAARVIGAFDALVCKVLSARHVGLLVRDEADGMLHQGGRVVRRVLQSPVGYRFLGVTRRDLAQGTAKALHAIEVMGEVPGEVLMGTCRAPHAPTAVDQPRENPLTDPTSLRSLPNLG